MNDLIEFLNEYDPSSVPFDTDLEKAYLAGKHSVFENAKGSLEIGEDQQAISQSLQELEEIALTLLRSSEDNRERNYCQGIKDAARTCYGLIEGHVYNLHEAGSPVNIRRSDSLEDHTALDTEMVESGCDYCGMSFFHHRSCPTYRTRIGVPHKVLWADFVKSPNYKKVDWERIKWERIKWEQQNQS